MKNAIDNAGVSLNRWDSNKVVNPFICSLTIDRKHPKNAAIEITEKIITEFGETELYKDVEKEFLEIKRRLQEKIKEHEEKSK